LTIERLERFAAQKTSQAANAVLSPLKTAVDTGGEGFLAIGNDWSRALFDGPFYVGPPWSNVPATSLVFVQSLDGNTGAKNPSTLGGGEADKHLIYEGLSRVAANAVLSGAETIRSGEMILSVWHPELVALRASLGLPRHPVQIVATLRGLPLDAGLMFNVPEVQVILLTEQACKDRMSDELRTRPWITTVVMRSAEDFPGAFRELRRLGIGTLSCIGGRTLARRLIDGGLVHDLYLTTSAKEGGEPNTPIYPRALPARVVVKKEGTGADAGVTFEHLLLSAGPHPRG
jgi:5-amino-6-(5-phosphoribosylamino)uracil reductase